MTCYESVTEKEKEKEEKKKSVRDRTPLFAFDEECLMRPTEPCGRIIRLIAIRSGREGEIAL